MLTQTQINNALATAERNSANGEATVARLKAERGQCHHTMRAAYDAQILAATRATMAENEYMDALRVVSKRIPRHADTIAPAPTMRAKAATIERKPIVDNGDDPSIAHGTPNERRNAKGQRERMTKRGKWMLADKGTATKRQREWLKANGVKGAHFFSMAGASDRRFDMTNR